MNHYINQRVTQLLLLVAFVVTANACSDHDPAKFQNAVIEYAVPKKSGTNRDKFITQLLEDIKAKTAASKKLKDQGVMDHRNEMKIDVALSSLTNGKTKDQLTNALIDAAKAGIKVRIVADTDKKTDFDVIENEATNNQNLTIKFIDNELIYMPDTTTITRSSKINILAHNFILIGKTIVWNFVTPLDDTAQVLGYRGESELLREDFTREFNQLFAGVDSTNVDAYGGPNKSTVFNHPYATEDGYFYYKDSIFTNQGRLRLLFSPQTRPVKTVIDEVYKAKESIYIQSNAICDENLIKVLLYKQKYGVNISIVVNEKEQNKCGTAIDIVKLKGYFSNNVRKTKTADSIPTIIVIEQNHRHSQQSPQRPRTAIVLNLPLYSAASISTTTGILSDSFVDGNGWILKETSTLNHKDQTIDKLTSLLARTFNNGATL